MLPAARRSLSRSFIRRLSTETNNASHIEQLPPSPPPRQRTRFSPGPRPAQSASSLSPSTQALPYLPPHFGRNQVLSVPDSTRALLEEITDSFNAPIRYAFAYGSGVFRQEGYLANGPVPLLDFVFAVNHPSHWHSINLHQNPSHYPLHARVFGSSFISKVQDVSPGVWFNAYVPVSGVMIKYGVTAVDNLCSDLLAWNTLYLSGRMHKPIRIIKDDARVRLTQQVNLVSALRVALLTLPEDFEETALFERVAQFSYRGDPRMKLMAEHPGKIGNIVRAQGPQFRELYQRLANSLPGVHWASDSAYIQQDSSARARAALVRKLPAALLSRIESRYISLYSEPAFNSDPTAFWLKVGADDTLPRTIDEGLSSIVRWPATVQSLKGVVSAGIGKSIRYGATKVGKWWSAQ